MLCSFSLACHKYPPHVLWVFTVVLWPLLVLIQQWFLIMKYHSFSAWRLPLPVTKFHWWHTLVVLAWLLCFMETFCVVAYCEFLEGRLWSVCWIIESFPASSSFPCIWSLGISFSVQLRGTRQGGSLLVFAVWWSGSGPSWRRCWQGLGSWKVGSLGLDAAWARGPSPRPASHPPPCRRRCDPWASGMRAKRNSSSQPVTMASMFYSNDDAFCFLLARMIQHPRRLCTPTLSVLVPLRWGPSPPLLHAMWHHDPSPWRRFLRLSISFLTLSIDCWFSGLNISFINSSKTPSFPSYAYYVHWQNL